MRQARIKVDAGQGEAVYHCMSRTVNGERLLDEVAREVMRKQLWAVARFCGVEIITHTILSNHFHVLVRVPRRTAIPDAELLARFAVLHPKPTRYQTAHLNVIREQLATNGPEAVAWRQRQLALMGDVSPFMKLLKQRFTVWFNRSHNRYGTLWSERFKSVLVEARTGVLRTLAAYIDLNAVRAGLVSDPKDYRFCGYAEAVAGHQAARRGLASIAPAAAWHTVQANYRKVLFGTGSGARSQARVMPREQFAQVVREKGQLPLATVLRHRVRYFSDGAVLGSRAFVQQHLAAYRRRTGRRARTTPRAVPPLADWGDLTTLRGLRRQPFS